MITATQVKSLMTNEDAHALASGEVTIDAALREYDSRPIVVDMSKVGAKRRVLERLCTMYREAGWSAAIRSGDQRDPGPFIEFEIASGPRSGPR